MLWLAIEHVYQKTTFHTKSILQNFQYKLSRILPEALLLVFCNFLIKILLGNLLESSEAPGGRFWKIW